MKKAAIWLMRFLSGHRPARVGFALVFVVLVVAVFGPLLASYEARQSFDPWLAPSADHWLGTDSQGYDLCTRMVYGARTTLLIALSATLLSLVFGSLIGAVAGYAGGWLDLCLMRAVDFAMSFPSFLLACVAVAIFGKELHNLIVAVGLVGAPLFARQIRAEVLRVCSMEYITAARALGLPSRRILFSHVVPNTLSPMIVLGTLGMGSAMLDVAGLNFLGLGGDPYLTAEWGLILKQGWDDASAGDVQVLAAGVAMFACVLGFNLLGDGLRDEFDPRAVRRRG